VTEKKRSPRDWEHAVEKQIREAIERGDFENLPGQGKALDLGDDPFTPRDWQLAYKILKDAGMAPDWIEQDKEIRAERQALASLLEERARWIRERVVRKKTLPPDRMIVEHERVALVREQTCIHFRERAADLNRQIDTFNLKVPSSRLHHPRIQIEEEIDKFLDASR
jgi:DnaJ family protein C protein 28